MSDKLQELTDRLYRDGVEKARTEAEAILADAEAQKDEIIRAAENDAASILEKSGKDVDALRIRTGSELATAARQAEAVLKQRIVNILVDNVLSESVRNALNDDTLLNELIISTTKAWVKDGEIPELSLVLSEEKQNTFAESLKSILKKEIDTGISIEFSDRIKNGFRIEPKDGSYAMSFTDKDFEEFFRSFLKEKSRAILFGDQ